jgi:hypothetical protein
MVLPHFGESNETIGDVEEGRIVMRGFGFVSGAVAVGAALLLAGSAPGQAENAKLDVKPGLWQVDSTGQTTGTPTIPPELLANLPPEKRAQAEAAMRAAMARAAAPRTDKSCITEKELQQGLDLGEGQDRSCKRSVVSNTSRLLVLHEVCGGKRPMVGDMRFEAVNRETMTGQISLVIGSGTDTTNMTRNLQGKWLGSDCGSVKPKE